MQVVIDISSNNPHPIDWGAVARSAVRGVMVKATEGTGYVNPHFGDDYFAALRAGLVPGAYHFWHPEMDDTAQLDWFGRHYTFRGGDLPPWWDAEVNPTNRSWSELGDRLHRIMDTLAARYRDAHLYVNRDWARNLEPHGFSWGHGVALAQGVSATLAAEMQFSPVAIPGIAGLTDWSVR